MLQLGKNSISPGNSQSFTHLFTGGYSYNIQVMPVDLERGLLKRGEFYEDLEKIAQELHLKVYTENGQKVGDDVGNLGPQCYLDISPGEPIKLKIVVSRDMTPNSRSNDKIEYQVIINVS